MAWGSELLFVLILIALAIAGGFAVVYFTSSMLRASGATKAAVKLVEGNMEAMALLGSPLTVERWVVGHISFYFRGGMLVFLPGFGTHATLSVPIRGSRMRTRLRARLRKEKGAWRAYSAYAYIGTRKFVFADDGK